MKDEEIVAAIDEVMVRMGWTIQRKEIYVFVIEKVRDSEADGTVVSRRGVRDLTMENILERANGDA